MLGIGGAPRMADTFDAVAAGKVGLVEGCPHIGIVGGQRTLPLTSPFLDQSANLDSDVAHLGLLA